MLTFAQEPKAPHHAEVAADASRPRRQGLGRRLKLFPVGLPIRDPADNGWNVPRADITNARNGSCVLRLRAGRRRTN